MRISDWSSDVCSSDLPRVAACLIGPGAGMSTALRERVLAALRTAKPVVLDADALTVFEETPELLFSAIQGPCLITPHEGEFDRILPDEGNKLEREIGRASCRERVCQYV